MTNGQNFRVNVSDFMQFLAGIAQLGDWEIGWLI
jgi:hypothetical protein